MQYMDLSPVLVHVYRTAMIIGTEAQSRRSAIAVSMTSLTSGTCDPMHAVLRHVHWTMVVNEHATVGLLIPSHNDINYRANDWLPPLITGLALALL